MFETSLVYGALLVFPALMAFAAMMDLVTMTIPNKISLGLLAGFLVAAIAVGIPLEQFLTHLSVGFFVLAVGVLLFALRVVGGGDAKLLAAASLWIGFEQLGQYMMYVAAIGGLLSVAILIYRRIVLPAWVIKQPWALRLHSGTADVPYGIAIGGAALVMFPATAWFALLAAA